MQIKVKPILQNCLILFLSAGSVHNAHASGFVPTASTTPSAVPPAAGSPAHEPVQIISNQSYSRFILNRTSTNFFEFFEPQSFLGKASITINFVRLKNGTVIFGNAKPEDADVKDKFYCQQALSELIPVAQPYGEASQISLTFPPKDQVVSKHDCFDLFYNKYSALQNKTVLIHIIPPSVLTRFPDLFTESEIHGLQNLIAVDSTFIDSQDLTFYRAEWADFLSNLDTKQATRQSICLRAENLLQQHKQMFYYLDTVWPMFKKPLAESGGAYDWMPNPYKKRFSMYDDSEQAVAMRNVIVQGSVTAHEKMRLTKAARSAADHGNYAVAVKNFKEFRETFKDGSLISEEVICLERLHQRDKAVELLKSMVRSQNEEIKVYQVFVDMELENGRYSEALALCEDLRKVSQFDSDAIALLRSKVLIAKKDIVGAENVLLDRLYNDIRHGADRIAISNALKELGKPVPDKAPEMHKGNDDVFRYVQQALNIKYVPNGREVTCVFKKDFENNQPLQNDWTWRGDWHDAEESMDSILVNGSRDFVQPTHLLFYLNLDHSYITKKMIVDKFAIKDELTDSEMVRDAPFLSSYPRLKTLHKKLDNGGISFLFSAIDHKQLGSIIRYWDHAEDCVPDYHLTDFDKHVENVERAITASKNKDAIQLIKEHWNDSYLGASGKEPIRPILEKKRNLLVKAFLADGNTAVADYLKEAPLCYITDDLANRCADGRLPSLDEYVKTKWMVRGDVESADSKRASYKLNKPGYRCITVRSGTPIFKTLFSIIGETNLSKVLLIDSKAISAGAFDDVYYSDKPE